MDENEPKGKPKIEEIEKLAQQIIGCFGCKHVTVLDFHYDWGDGSYRIVIESVNKDKDGKAVFTPNGRDIETIQQVYNGVRQY